LLLLSNRIEEGERDVNPLGGLLLRERPEAIGEAIAATFDNRIQLLGYECRGACRWERASR
jgi:hypothetical protein